MNNTFDKRSLIALAVAFVLCFGAAALGGFFTGPVTSEPNGWFALLAKPSWNPPSWLFGPVWSLLFGMMAVSGWLVWSRTAGKERTAPAIFFGVQLALNVLWSALFFGLKRPDLAALEIGALWLAILGTILVFRRYSTPAAWLLVPYLLWVSFATALNITIWQLNA